MSAERKKAVRCAIYTRKSTEEGLEQAFNSLEAQRESCSAYIQSQRHEGWQPVAAHYDDGGFSGGSMKRPALQRLLDDIDAGKVDTVVVYKVDRLTRSLADFAKIVEIFNAKGISFISVTQQFNTTTSMGRLTLNVLLSFAQFEREVTGERIRDKIAASKRKGMWMGGRVPLGYTQQDRKLIVDRVEAERVCHIYNRYLELGCVDKLKAELDGSGSTSKVRISSTGRKTGGLPYSRGALYSILQSCIYVGEIPHRGLSYPGQHEAIMPRETWDRVQALLKANRHARRVGVGARESSLLAGLIYDDANNRLTPSHTGKKGKRYRYYVSPPSIRRQAGAQASVVRVPAYEIEELVSKRIQTFLASSQSVFDATARPEDTTAITQAILAAANHRSTKWSESAFAETREFLLSAISRIEVKEQVVDVLIERQDLRQVLLGEKPKVKPGTGRHKTENAVRLSIEAQLRRCGRELRLILPPDSAKDSPARAPVPALIKVLARAHSWYGRMVSGEVKNQKLIADEAKLPQCYVSRVMQCAFLAPDIVEAILEGRQPADLTLEKLLSGLPMDWAGQRRRLGFASVVTPSFLKRAGSARTNPQGARKKIRKRLDADASTRPREHISATPIGSTLSQGEGGGHVPASDGV